METTSTAEHWDQAYAQGDATRSWYQAEAQTSLELILPDHPRPVSVVDVGGGASTLVDGLLDAGWRDLTVTDISPLGMATAQQRLGDRSSTVTWIQADVRTWQPPRRWDLWHDRAVLHFMTSETELAGYHRALLAGTTAGATAVIGCFGPQGPTACSGLPVTRYDEQGLAEFLGPEFEVLDSRIAQHTTPAGGAQEFLWLRAKRRSAL